MCGRVLRGILCLLLQLPHQPYLISMVRFWTRSSLSVGCATFLLPPGLILFDRFCGKLRIGGLRCFQGLAVLVGLFVRVWHWLHAFDVLAQSCLCFELWTPGSLRRWVCGLGLMRRRGVRNRMAVKNMHRWMDNLCRVISMTMSLNILMRRVGMRNMHRWMDNLCWMSAMTMSLIRLMSRVCLRNMHRWMYNLSRVSAMTMSLIMLMSRVGVRNVHGWVDDLGRVMAMNL